MKLDQVRNEINVTPLVDVCLVLLIIFMVILPMLALGLWRREWRSTVVAGVVSAAVALSLFAVNLAVTGEANYQGGDRNTFYGGAGFPLMTPEAGFRSAPGGSSILGQFPARTA